MDIVSKKDLERSYSTREFDCHVEVLAREAKDRELKSYADLGCCYGGITATTSAALDIETSGVDIDERVIEEARNNGGQAPVHDQPGNAAVRRLNPRPGVEVWIARLLRLVR